MLSFLVRYASFNRTSPAKKKKLPLTIMQIFHCERVLIYSLIMPALSSTVTFSPSPLSQELPKTLSAGLLPNPLAVAAAMAAAASSSQLALRPPGPTPLPHRHLLQGAPLNLLRPAPGPIRTTHGPILFAPY